MIFYIGLLCFIGGVYFLLVNLNIIHKRNKEESFKPIEARRIDNILIRIGSISLCIIGIYLIWPDEGKQQSKSNPGQPSSSISAPFRNTQVWSEDLKEILNKQCLENGKRTAEQYPDLVKDYCKCATDQISQSMTPEEYTQWMDKPKEEQAKSIRPIVQTCVDILNKLIELTEQTKPKKPEPKKN